MGWDGVVAYEETQSNRVSAFRDFVRSLFPTAILFDFSYMHKMHRIRFISRKYKVSSGDLLSMDN